MYRKKIIANLLAMGFIMIVCLSACSRAPENPAWFQSTEDGEPLDEQALNERISKVNDIMTLYRMKEDYFSRGGESPDVAGALSKRMDLLAAEEDPLASPCPEIDLLGFDFQRIGSGRYRAEFLFRSNDPVENDLAIALCGVVLPEDRNLLSPARRKAGKKSETWVVRLRPPSSTWNSGEYILVTSNIAARPIPYNMSLSFYDPEKKSGEQGFGETVSLGWCRSIPDEDLLDAIAEAGSIIDLYRLAGDSRRGSEVGEAFEKKAAELLKKTPAPGRICPEAELVAFDYKHIKDKRYRIDYLFRVDHPLDMDCLINLVGVVDKNHREFISEQRRKMGKKSEVWAFRPFPGTKNWPVKKYILFSEEIEAEPVPYEMYTSLYNRDERRQHGERVSLGWRVNKGVSETEGE